ncbi:hypothetical protein [Pararhizobium sp.]|uniref:hypothetical protein n=1 Tax=Pararhizobium sp. TaxID=1977563 RepID=UPI00271C4F85|nr:hypothetical protein [Pararhizobium sp.]MDO9417838.1 hypothetical protein [Pararhizobium sp.]
MRLFFRLASFIVLVLAIFAGAIDSIQSVSASEPVLTATGAAWFAFSPSTLNMMQAVVQRYLHPAIWDPGIQWVLLQPAFAVLLALSLILWMIGYKRRPIAGRFTA